MQELGKDPWDSPSWHMPPPASLRSYRVFYTHLTPGSGSGTLLVGMARGGASFIASKHHPAPAWTCAGAGKG